MWLHRASGDVTHHGFRQVPDLLERGDLLVLNDTRVSALRLLGRKPTGAAVEALLLRPGSGQGEYVALMRPGRRLPVGSIVDFEAGLRAEVVAVDPAEGVRSIRFQDPSDLDARLSQIGQTPLPPYIHERLDDSERYQTVFAKQPGSAAAPTAGLHFTNEILEALEIKGVRIAFVTLDVGIDTFRPIVEDDLDKHCMHGERCSAPLSTAQAIEACTGRVIAVGTTAVRTIETLAIGDRKIKAGATTSYIFIQPGYAFRIVDGLFTNFHLPRTSMLVMLSAFVRSDSLMSAYRQAVSHRYRFLSFGDSMLIV